MPPGKDALRSQEDVRARAAANAKFFVGIEGMSSFSPAHAINGLYVATRPCLRLDRVVALKTVEIDASAEAEVAPDFDRR